MSAPASAAWRCNGRRSHPQGGNAPEATKHRAQVDHRTCGRASRHRVTGRTGRRSVSRCRLGKSCQLFSSEQGLA